MKKITLSILGMALAAFAFGANAGNNHTCNLNVNGKAVYTVKVEEKSQCPALMQAEAIKRGLVPSSAEGTHTCNLSRDGEVVKTITTKNDEECKAFAQAEAAKIGAELD